MGDLETTTGYISEIEGGLMFATSYCLMFNFHPKLYMIPVTCLRSFGQTENELKFITIPEKFHPYINRDDLRCFRDACNNLLQKKQKLAVSTLCMIEMWMVCRCLKNYFDTVVKVKNSELTEDEKRKFHVNTHCNSFLKEYSPCYLCEFPVNAKEINYFDLPTRECSRLDFVIRKEYQLLKNVLSKDEIKNPPACPLSKIITRPLVYLLNAYKHFSRQADYPVHLDESKLDNEYKSFIVDFMSDCSTVDHLHKQIQEFKILRNKNASRKQRAFCVNVCRLYRLSRGLPYREEICFAFFS